MTPDHLIFFFDNKKLFRVTTGITAASLNVLYVNIPKLQPGLVLKGQVNWGLAAIGVHLDDLFCGSIWGNSTTLSSGKFEHPAHNHSNVLAHGSFVGQFCHPGGGGRTKPADTDKLTRTKDTRANQKQLITIHSKAVHR